MREITSLKNPAVQAARSLATAKGRAAEHAFLCDGEHMVTEALHACPQSVRAVFADASLADRYAGLIDSSCELYVVPASILEAVSQVKTPQGVAAVCTLPAPVAPDALRGRLVLLENVQDPGNVGTILRTLDAAGFDGCILTRGCADPYAPKTLRATMGSVFRVPVAMADDAAQAVAALNARGYATIGAELHGAPFYERKTLPEQVCLLIGNEGAGLTAAALQCCTHRYKLPMRGGAESLNAAVAAAVMMYDLMNR